MADFPTSKELTLHGGGFFSTFSQETSIIWGTSPGSKAWSSANLAIFMPVRLPVTVTVYKITIGAGATAAGNFDVGIYDASGNRLVSSGATAKGASVEHVIDVTDTVIGPGLYYLALAADGTNNYICWTPGGTSPVPLQKIRLAGTVEMAAAYPLPSTATFAAASSATVWPSICAYIREY